jgi:MFS family permease
MKRSDRLSIRKAIGVLLIVGATYMLGAMDRTVFATLLPSLAKEFGFTLEAGGFLATVFTLGFGLAGIPASALLDRWSCRVVAAVGICLYSVLTALTCLSTGLYDMAAYRVMSGIGEGLQNAAIFTIAGAYFANERTLAFGALNVAYGVGAFIGPRWGASMLAAFDSWRLPLLVYAGLGAPAALAMLYIVPARFAERRFQPNNPVDAELHIPATLINRNTVLVGCAAIGGGFVSLAYLGLYPTFLRGELGFSVEAAGTAAGMFGVGALTGLPSGYIADRVNQKWLTIFALICLALTSYAIFNIAISPLWQNFLSFLEGVTSSGLLYVNNYSLMQRSVRSSMTGRASGLMVICVYLPAALSGYVFAGLVARVGWGNAALLQMCLLLLIPVIAMLFFKLERTSCKIGGVDLRNRA